MSNVLRVGAGSTAAPRDLAGAETAAWAVAGSEAVGGARRPWPTAPMWRALPWPVSAQTFAATATTGRWAQEHAGSWRRA